MVMKIKLELLGAGRFWGFPRMCMHHLAVPWLPPYAISGSVALGDLGRSEGWEFGVE